MLTVENDTHANTTDPDSRLYRKAAGREARLSYMGHATMENRRGLAVAGMVTFANGTAERCARRRCSRPKSRKPAAQLARPTAARYRTRACPGVATCASGADPTMRASVIKPQAGSNRWMW